uniref:Uncharacterized protein n=1 Tax=Glossina palpalis gambiensis TaxID=67801 RepID=A0A1B0AWI4_9MUSC
MIFYSSTHARYQFPISINKESRIHRPHELTGGHVPAHKAPDLKSTNATDGTIKLSCMQQGPCTPVQVGILSVIKVKK